MGYFEHRVPLQEMPPIRPEGPHNTVYFTPLFVLAPLLVFFTSNPVSLYQETSIPTSHFYRIQV